ncbi:calcium homeostasis modulator protein 6 [Caerostris extrusa]|uniref:Calcium homeostasis modulator protein 6 n=1 Tax=Caerostris extrusa TaxID=172846 RepID=A0AAV4SNH9_CAEEX|nr:calcium homeostasis modulator protein 6 [Caerostris extrusa]
MSKIPAFLTGVNNLLKSHPVCFTNSFLIALSAGGERIFQTVVFQCPKDVYTAWYYGWIFLFSPFFALFICAMVMNNTFWLHAMVANIERTIKTPVQRMLQKACVKTFCTSLVVPSTWLFVSLLDGEYVACSLSKTPDDKSSLDYQHFKAMSQMCGWAFLVLVIVVGTVCTCYMRCCDKKTYLEARYASVYTSVEDQVLEKEMQEKAQIVAQQHVGALFESNMPAKEVWDKIAKMDVTKDATTNYYSPLQKWSSSKV